MFPIYRRDLARNLYSLHVCYIALVAQIAGKIHEELGLGGLSDDELKLVVIAMTTLRDERNADLIPVLVQGHHHLLDLHAADVAAIAIENDAQINLLVQLRARQADVQRTMAAFHKRTCERTRKTANSLSVVEAGSSASLSEKLRSNQIVLGRSRFPGV